MPPKRMAASRGSPCSPPSPCDRRAPKNHQEIGNAIACDPCAHQHNWLQLSDSQDEILWGECVHRITDSRTFPAFDAATPVGPICPTFFELRHAEKTSPNNPKSMLETTPCKTEGVETKNPCYPGEIIQNFSDGVVPSVPEWPAAA